MYDIQVQFGSNLLLQKFGVPYLKILLYRVPPKALRFFWYLEVLFGEIQLYYYGPSLFKLNIYLLERQRTGNGRWKEWDWAPIQWLLLEGYNSPGPGWGCHCCWAAVGGSWRCELTQMGSVLLGIELAELWGQAHFLCKGSAMSAQSSQLRLHWDIDILPSRDPVVLHLTSVPCYTFHLTVFHTSHLLSSMDPWAFWNSQF